MEAIQFIQDLAVILLVAAAVGWFCQRIGLSSVVGYLVAGAVVGPNTPPVSLVTDVPRVETLAQVGLVFLMFSIGMRLSLHKLRRLGFGLLLAVCSGAGIVFAVTRLTCTALGLSNVESLFLAGMMMVSSSAIISKVLTDCGATHDRPGQLAMGVTVLEDVVAVVMLTLLNSIVQFGDAGRSARIGETLGMMSAFVVMAGISGMLLVPWLLRRMSISADEELQTLGLGGLLFGLALLAQKAGYSTALGAFLLGTIVAETPHRAQVERIFEGMRSIFTAVFFVAIGMQIEPRLLASAALPILAVTLFTLLVRTLACTVGLTLVGVSQKEALRTGLIVLPIGEFSFIIAQLGVNAGVVPKEFYPIAVGLSLATAIFAPFATKHSEGIAEKLLKLNPAWLDDLVRAYHSWLEQMALLQKKNLLWQLSRKRLIQITTGILFVTGLLVFSGKLLEVVVEWFGNDRFFSNGTEVLFWVLITLLVLPPLVAIWRNLSAMAMLYSQVRTQGSAERARMQPALELGLRVLAGCGMFIWLVTVLPTEGMARWLLFLCGALALVALVFLRRKLIYWHSEIEVELQQILSPARAATSATTAPWLQSNEEWNIAVVDCVVPDLADCRGKSIGELRLRSENGASIVGIERQGYMIPLPGPEAVLYPRDKVLLMGNSEQVRAGSRRLQQVSGLSAESAGTIEDIRMEKMQVDAASQASGRSLGELAPSTRFGVQIAGIQRAGVPRLSLGSSDLLYPGDELLVLGTHAQIKAFRKWLLAGDKNGDTPSAA